MQKPIKPWRARTRFDYDTWYVSEGDSFKDLLEDIPVEHHDAVFDADDNNFKKVRPCCLERERLAEEKYQAEVKIYNDWLKSEEGVKNRKENNIEEIIRLQKQIAKLQSEIL